MGEKVQHSAKTAEVKRENSAFKTRAMDYSQSMSSPVDQVLYLQRTIGNQAVQRLIKSGTLQAKLKIGQPGDKYEQEADRVTDAVMRMPEQGVQQQVEPEKEGEETLQSKLLASQITPLVQVQRQEEPEEEEETIQAKPLVEEIIPLVQRQVEPEEEEEEEMLQAKSREDATSEVPNDLESQINAIKSGGKPLAKSELAFFEPRFGHDFSQVRLHTDTQAVESAQALNAQAFTMGSDVVFGVGKYSPGTREGQSLMAHELTHVVQQSGNLAQPQIQRMGDPSQIPSGFACTIANDSPGVSDLDIIFRVNSASLTSSDRANINNFVNNWHSSGANKNLRLDGYASPEGADSLNWTLSCNRATAIKNALMSLGISVSYIEMFAHGETSEFAAANSPNRRVSIQMQGGSPNQIPPGTVLTRVIPCSAMPREIINRGACGADTDFTFNDFPPLTGTNAAQQAAVLEADTLKFDFQLSNRMRLELGVLGGGEGLRMVTHFSGGTGTKLTHDSSSTLGADAIVCGTFLRLHSSVIREIESQLASMDAAGVIDCNAITLPTRGVPAVSFGFSDSLALKAIIGGTQGLRIRITRFSVNPGSHTYDIDFQYLICDDFGVDTADLYSPALIAFWVLQHRRSGYVPFINELDLPKTERGHY